MNHPALRSVLLHRTVPVAFVGIVTLILVNLLVLPSYLGVRNPITEVTDIVLSISIYPTILVQDVLRYLPIPYGVQSALEISFIIGHILVLCYLVAALLAWAGRWGYARVRD